MKKFELPKLEYSYDSLEPFIDARTMEIHHTKHHQAYIDKLNAALEKHPEWFERSIGGIIKDLNKVPEDIKTAVRNNGGGHANHSWFWEIMTPDKIKREFKGEIAEAIVSHFGSFEDFKKQFSEAGMNRFGSGWVWLVLNGEKLEILSTPNQDNPLSEGKTPLLGLDVWEHAYYLNYQNRKADYINNWFNVINWDKVNELFAK